MYLQHIHRYSPSTMKVKFVINLNIELATDVCFLMISRREDNKKKTHKIGHQVLAK